jgi:DNA-binding GntR family transcriptional regulator
VTPIDRHAEANVSDATQIRHSPLGRQVYDLLWKRIIHHQLRPGDRLSDLHLSKELGVSRTPVREALHRLSQDGVVRAESRRGFFVASFSSQDADELYDLREALEVLAVRLALPRLADDELSEAERALDAVACRLAAGDEAAAEEFLSVDRAFHQLLVRAANNQRLAAMMTALQAQISVFQVYGIHMQDLLELSIAHHRAILAALRQRDSEAAQHAMQRHIRDVKQRVLAELKSLEDGRADVDR